MTRQKQDSEAARNRPLNALDRLREALERLEIDINTLTRGTAEDALRILPLLDEATDTLRTLQEKGSNVQAELARLETVYAQFQKRGAAFLKRLGGAKALSALREETAPPPEHWWWWIDDFVTEQRLLRRRQMLTTAAIVAGLAVIVVIIYRLFLAPDPALVAKIEHLRRAEMIIREGGVIDDALAEANLALEAMPEDAESLITRGVLLADAGDSAAADIDFLTAKDQFEDQVDFLLLRTQVYLRLLHPDDALADVETVLEAAPDSPEGYYLLGSVYQSTELLGEAQAAFEQAAALAGEAGNTQLEALARVQVSQVMQMMMSQPLFATLPPTETP